MQQSGASSMLSPDEEEEEEMPSKVWARRMTNAAGTLTDWGAMGVYRGVTWGSGYNSLLASQLSW